MRVSKSSRRIAGLLFGLCSGLAMAQAGGALDILEFAVEGNTALRAEAVERAVTPFLGPGRAVSDVDAARAALEKAYHDAGFLTVTVEVPNQKVDEGVVVLQVVEGRIERYKVSGAEYTLPSKVREATPSMAAGTVPNFNEIQEDLTRLGRNPDLRVNPLLRPGARPGSVEIELAMEDASPLHGSIELNNKQGADTDTGRVEAAVRYDNLWQRRHSIGFNYFVAPTDPDHVQVWGVNYAMPVGKATLAGYFVRSNSDVPTVFDTQSLGDGDTLGLRWIRPLPLAGRLYHSVSLGADYKDNDQTTVLLDEAFTVQQPLRYWALSAAYSGGYVGDDGEWKFGASVVLGPRGPNERTVRDSAGNPVDQFENRRPGARPNFSLWRADLEYRHPFGAGWQALARAELQGANGPLVNTEQFSAGGMDSVRGYLEGELQGDDGMRLALELQTPSLLTIAERYPLIGVAFYDWARLRTRDAAEGQRESSVLASAGLGLRVGDKRGLSGELLWATVFHDGASAEDRTRDGDGAAVLRMKYEF